MNQKIIGLVLAVFSNSMLFSAQETPAQVSSTFVEIFNKHDAKELSDLWAADAIYTSPDGDEVVGREEILQGYQELFKEDIQIKLTLKDQQIKFLAPNLAQEEGAAITTGKETDETRYLAYFVYTGEKWELISYTEVEAIKPISHYEELKNLEWMIGNFQDSDEEANVEVTSQWSKNKNFIIRSFVATVPGGDHFEGTQVVGWDPALKTIRSWTFDSDGGVSVGNWRNIGDQWYIHSKAVLPDGKVANVTNIIKKINDTSFSWRTTGLTIDGELQPDIEEITLNKVGGSTDEAVR